MTKLALWLLPQVSWISDREIRRLKAALAIMAAPCAAEWMPGEPAPTVDVASRAADIPDEGIPVVFSPTIDQPGDLAYHTLLDGRPYSLVLADPQQVALADVQTGAGHEVCEMIGDLTCDQRILLPTGNLIDQEISDPTEGDTIPVDLGDGGDPLAMSNWVTRAWFKAGSPPGTKLDAAGVCVAPLLVRPNGYAMEVDPTGSIHQIGQGPAAYKRHPIFRHGRRLANAHALAMKIRMGLAA